MYTFTYYIIFSLWYVRDSVCVKCGSQSVSCAEFSLYCVRDSVCVMCGIQSVLCTEFSMCYVRDSVCALYGDFVCVM